MSLQSRIREYLARPVPVTALSIFRILFCLVTLFYWAELIVYRHLIFDTVPYLEPAWWPVTPLLVLGAAAVTCVLLGVWVKAASAVMWLICVFVLGGHLGWYHGEYMFQMVFFLFIFLPVDKTLTVRSALRRRALSAEKPATVLVPIGCYLIPVFLTLGFQYVDSVLWKFDSWHWMAGLGVWLPMATPFSAQIDATPMLDHAPVLWMAASWATVVYEAIFIVLMWFARARVPLAIFGIGLHASIALAFPIPVFGIQGVLMLTLLMPGWPQWVRGVWNRLRPGGKPQEPSAVTVMAGSGLLTSRVVTTAVALLTVGQLLLTLTFTVPALLNVTVPRALVAPGWIVLQVSRPVFGIALHALFVSSHFDGRNHEYRVVDNATSKPLPIVDDHGLPSRWQSRDELWPLWVFNDAKVPPTDMALRYIAFNLGPEALRSDNTYTFTVQAKYIPGQRAWAPGVLTRAKAQPWYDVATVSLHQGQADWTILPAAEARP